MTKKEKRHPRSPIVIIIVVFAFIAGRYSDEILFPRTQKTLCTYVTDGDTIEVDYRGIEERVRLIGIDTAEIRNTKKLREQARRAGISDEEMLRKGQEAKRIVESMVLGKTVELRFEGKRLERDDFGRLLCDVYVDGTNVAQHLTELGFEEFVTVNNSQSR